MDLRDYADGVFKVVNFEPSYKRIGKDWIPNWSRTLRAIQKAKGIFELYSTICARWEFLGGLYLGTTDDTNYEEALEYVSQFLIPINRKYASIIDISGQSNAFEFFSIFRNKAVHGATPAAIATTNRTKVIGWWIGAEADLHTQKYHLQIKNGMIFVDGEKIISEFLTSLLNYSNYLRLDRDIMNGLKPSDRWIRAFWARFKPLNLEKAYWMNEGYQRGVHQ